MIGLVQLSSSLKVLLYIPSVESLNSIFPYLVNWQASSIGILQSKL